ncbi:unnamed protein product [Amaranthus hypochondriacus]
MAGHNCKELTNLHGLVVRLANEIDYKNHRLMENEGLSLEKFATMSSLIEEKDRLLGERSEVIGSLMAQKHRLHEAFVEEKRKSALMKQDMKNVRHELNVQLQELDAKNKKLEVLQALNDQRPKTVTTKHTNANGCFESLKIDLNVPTNQSHISFKKHDELELQMSLEKLQHLKAQNEDLKSQLKKLRKELDEKREALCELESLNQSLRLNESSSTEELKAARLEVINCFYTVEVNGTKVGLKRIGEIDTLSFRDVCSKRFCSSSWEEKSNELYHLWQEKVNDPSWNPFQKVVKNGVPREVVNENDENLAALRDEWGEESHKAVVNALLELKMYNPSTRSCIPELWNFEEGRRAYLKEALECMIHQLEFHRNKDSEQSGVIINLMEENKSLLEKLASTNVIMEAKDKLLKEKYAKVRSSIGVGYEEGFSASENVSNYQPINYREIVNAEKRNMQVMKEDLGKLKHELQSQKELAAQTEKDKETPGHNFEGEKSLVIKEESMDWHLDSLTNLVGPKVNDFEVHDTIEKIGSTSEIIKFQGEKTREKLQHPKAELDNLEGLLYKRLNASEVSGTTKLEAATSSPLQHSIVL